MSTKELDLIIALLRQIEEDDSIEFINTSYTHPFIQSIIYLADNVLTGDDNFKNIKYIQEKGFPIFPGEQDRFGWLTGCIQLKKGIIVFG
jgi:alpha-amylase/alpha-mannosidase (GH57 family)